MSYEGRVKVAWITNSYKVHKPSYEREGKPSTAAVFTQRLLNGQGKSRRLAGTITNALERRWLCNAKEWNEKS